MRLEFERDEAKSTNIVQTQPLASISSMQRDCVPITIKIIFKCSVT
jgi:hypothetical protein